MVHPALQNTSFRREARRAQHLEAARAHVAALGDPRAEDSPQVRAAREGTLGWR